MKKKRFYIVDTMAMIFRCHYGYGLMPRVEDHFPTGATYGSQQFLSRLIKKERPDYLLLVKDSKGPTFRHELYPDYKAHRPSMPLELVMQLPMIEKLYQEMGLTCLGLPGYEADDLIGTIVQSLPEDVHGYIISRDKDFTQLISDRVFLLAPQSGGGFELFDQKKVIEKYGCHPDQIPDFLALVGDAADNVPGVPGIGEKTASKLLQTYHSISGIYSHLDHISNQKVKKALFENKSTLQLSRRLVEIKKDVPWDFQFERYRQQVSP